MVNNHVYVVTRHSKPLAAFRTKHLANDYAQRKHGAAEVRPIPLLANLPERTTRYTAHIETHGSHTGRIVGRIDADHLDIDILDNELGITAEDIERVSDTIIRDGYAIVVGHDLDAVRNKAEEVAARHKYKVDWADPED